MHSPSTRLVTSTLFFSVLAQTFVFAQSGESPAAEIEELQDVVVTEQSLQSDQATALKSPTPILNVPQSLTLITAERIQDQGFDSIQDLVDYTPGVTTSQGEAHRDAVVFRGTRSTADFYIDGVRDDVQYYRSLYNVAQVEFLRGPNALLFGRGGTGGIINRVSKKGVPGTSFTDFRLTLDTFGGYSAQFDRNHAVDGNAAVRVNALFEHLENHRDYFDGDRVGMNPVFHIRLTDDTTLDLSYEYVDNERVIDRGIPTGADGEPVERFPTNSSPGWR